MKNVNYTLDTNVLRNLSELFLSQSFKSWHTDVIRGRLGNENIKVADRDIANYWGCLIKDRLDENEGTVCFSPLVACELIKHLGCQEKSEVQRICFYALCIYIKLVTKESQVKAQYLFDEKLCMIFFNEPPTRKFSSLNVLV